MNLMRDSIGQIFTIEASETCDDERLSGVPGIAAPARRDMQLGSSLGELIEICD